MKKITLIAVLITVLISCSKEDTNSNINNSTYGYYIVNGVKHTEKLIPSTFGNLDTSDLKKNSNIVIGINNFSIDTTVPFITLNSMNNSNPNINLDSFKVTLSKPFEENFSIHKNNISIIDLNENYVIGVNVTYKLYNIKGSFKSPKGNNIEINVKAYRLR
jgi:hypothetical protein